MPGEKPLVTIHDGVPILAVLSILKAMTESVSDGVKERLCIRGNGGGSTDIYFRKPSPEADPEGQV